MEFFGEVYRGVEQHPTAAILVLTVIAFGWFVRDARAREQRAAEKIAALYERHAETMSAEHSAHLQTAMQIAPLAQKLVTCVEILERLSVRSAP